MKPSKLQREAAESKAPIVVLRWGRQTGKNVLIEQIMDKETDFVIEPNMMAAETAKQWEGWSVFQEGVINKSLLHYIKRNQVKHHRTKKIFLNECAWYEKQSLFELIKLLQAEWPKAQIYMISTPRGGWKLHDIGSAGFEFDLICSRLELTNVHGWFYSRKPNTDMLKIALERGDEQSDQTKQEALASWWEIK